MRIGLLRDTHLFPTLVSLSLLLTMGFLQTEAVMSTYCGIRDDSVSLDGSFPESDAYKLHITSQYFSSMDSRYYVPEAPVTVSIDINDETSARPLLESSIVRGVYLTVTADDERIILTPLAPSNTSECSSNSEVHLPASFLWRAPIARASGTHNSCIRLRADIRESDRDYVSVTSVICATIGNLSSPRHKNPRKLRAPPYQLRFEPLLSLVLVVACAFIA